MIQAIKKWAGKSERNLNTLIFAVAWVFMATTVPFLQLLFATSSENWRGVFFALFMVSASSVSVGLLIGFLFGIPRTLQGLPEAADARLSESVRQRYMVNTNLEQVSDWLTKIIVGVGLVQFGFVEIVQRTKGAARSPLANGEPVELHHIGRDIADDRAEKTLVRVISLPCLPEEDADIRVFAFEGAEKLGDYHIAFGAHIGQLNNILFGRQ